jgi:hypothetical protein
MLPHARKIHHWLINRIFRKLLQDGNGVSLDFRFWFA